MCATKPLLVRNQSSKHTAINRKKKRLGNSLSLFMWLQLTIKKRFKFSKTLVPVGPVFEFREKYNKKE